MHTLEKKQLNLLVHLAKVDGKFAKTEHDLLMAFIREKQLDPSLLNTADTHVRWHEVMQDENRVELLYWAIRMMHADGIIHEEEIRFCKQLAGKIGLREDLVDWATQGELPEWDAFRRRAHR